MLLRRNLELNKRRVKRWRELISATLGIFSGVRRRAVKFFGDNNPESYEH